MKSKALRLCGVIALGCASAEPASAQFLPQNQITSGGSIPELTYSALIARAPCTPTTKIMAIITDAPTPVAWGSTISTGGGTGRALVVCDGTNWVVH